MGRNGKKRENLGWRSCKSLSAHEIGSTQRKSVPFWRNSPTLTLKLILERHVFLFGANLHKARQVTLGKHFPA